MDDPIILSLTVRQPILARPELSLPSDQVFFTRSGRCFQVRELPLNYGRWLGHLMNGSAEERSHSYDETVDELVNLAGDQTPPRTSGPGARQWQQRA